MGQRIAKEVYDANNNWEKTTYYVRDPQGNVMAIYEKVVDAQTQQLSYKVTERDMFGSSRVGLNTQEIEMIGATVSGSVFTHVIGKKQYELSNHLGNVLSTVTDRAIPKDWDADLVVDYFRAEIVAAYDYTPFGVMMDGRKFENDAYRYSFNGQEKDGEIAEGIYTAEFWQYDSRLGRRWNIDPVIKPTESSYSCLFNSPIRVIDPDGDDGYVDEDGNYLGDDGDEKSSETRVINKDTWNTLVGDGKNISEETRKKLQTDITYDSNNKQSGNSKRLNEYEKGIKITDATWKKLTDMGATKLTPYVENNSDETVFYKPEGSKDDKNLNPYASYNGAYPIAANTDLYSPVDGVNTSQVDDGEVFKAPTGSRVEIDGDGDVDLIDWWDLTPFIGEVAPPDPSWTALEESIKKD